MTDRLSSSELDRAARLLARGELVAFPTETVYGLGADARNDVAVAQIFEAKGRPAFNPLIVHVASIEQAREIAVFDATAERLAAAFWPGALSLVLPVRVEAGISKLVTAGLGTVALRCPEPAMARDLVARAGCPVAAPSANISGKISPTTADHVLDGLSGKIAAVLDGGPCAVGLESTIVGGNPVALLRPGGVPVEAIEACLGQALASAEEGAVTAPGQLASHYAPQAALRLNASEARGDEVLIGFGDVAGEMSLSASGDLIEAAARLFAVLHAADATGRAIAVAPVPDHGIGRAINDRLRRAAAPR
jgi:L-threonylcarbamoyladenylate synthase